MKEFGSDFHYIEPGCHLRRTLGSFYPSANYYADGRQALIHLYRTQGWERLWIPEYFCYDVVESLKQAGLDVIFYADNPGYREDGETIAEIQRKGHFRAKDAFLRVNYFGMRSYRSSGRIQIPVVEDHTHDLIGGWALESSADWCVASLRKTLPIPEGGMLWSPKGLPLPDAPEALDDNEAIATTRWNAMELKTRYLAGEDVEKSLFRAGFVNTEEFFDRAPVCALDGKSLKYLETFDVRNWYNRKKENWELLRDIKKAGMKVMRPEDENCNPFSMILLFDSLSERVRVRRALIEHQIYPAVLWDVPNPTDGDIFKISRGMLSIHCDARYTKEDILQMKFIIESILEH